MTVRRTHSYSETWDKFIDRILCPDFELAGTGKLERLTQQLRWDQKIGMIVALSKDWTAREHRNSGEARKRQRAAAAAEVARLTRDDAALMPYVDEPTRALMPPAGVQQRDRLVRRQATSHATDYFRRLDQRPLPRIEQIIGNDLRLSPQQWAAAHPYGPKVSIVDLDQYRANQVRPWRLRHKKMAYSPAGMTPERALEIAIRSLR